jgi:thiosulfate/3-mercaptopyruvate sulfurtransferase
MPHSTIVSTDTLAKHLDGTWVIVDCRFDLQDADWGPAQYRAAHIPGAVYASLKDHLSAPPNGANGRHPLPHPTVIAETFGRLGITNDVQVVLYDQDSGMFASRMWWMLRFLGHDQAAVLDGGWARWTAEGRPTRAGDESRPAATLTTNVRHDARLMVDEVEPLVGNRQVRFVDARAPERFEGRTEPMDRVAGHIPGAANHHYKQNLADDGTMLPPEKLRDQFTRTLGGHPPAQTIMYCGSGVSACHNLLAMEHAGLGGAKLYVGSWSEWSSDPERPVETGPAKS